MDWQFDIRTSLFIGAGLTFLTGLLMWLARNGVGHAQRPSMRWWALALLSYATGPLLIGMRGDIPDVGSVVLGNLFTAMGFAGFAIALRRFLGLSPLYRTQAVLCALVVLDAVVFHYLLPSLNARMIGTSLLMALQLGIAAWTLLRHARPMSTVTAVTAGMLVFSASVLLTRVGVFALTPLPQESAIFSPLPLQIATYGIAGVLPIVGTIGFLLMCFERSQRELSDAARLDYLTGVFNRRAMEEVTAASLARSRRHGQLLALLIVDIDHFKQVNDEFGHAAGDAALIESVRRIREALRAEDFVGRIGGEEFQAVLPGADARQAAIAAERVRRAFADHPMRIEGRDIHLTVSVGVAVLAAGDLEHGPLVRRADQALYAAKSAGRNCVRINAEHGA